VALGLMMIVPVLGALAQTAPTRTEAWIHRFVLVGVFMRAITTYSRGGFLGALILGLVGFFRSGKKARYVIAAGVLAVVVFTVMPDSFWDRISTITATDENRDESANGRLHFWGVGLRMAYAKPLTGVGFNGFTPSYESYNPDEEFGGERAVHSVWFGVLADLGFPGLLLFVSTWSGAMWTCWRVSAACKKDPERNDVRLYANALLSSLTVFAVAGTFLSVQYGEMFWHFVCMATALAPLANEAAAPVQQNATSGRPRVARDPAMAQL
jgi:probable O-glycosylation ligase (exosortase A-associated)